MGQCNIYQVIVIYFTIAGNGFSYNKGSKSGLQEAGSDGNACILCPTREFDG
ncbi:hypothetical protein D3C74_440410 [compost metagenome]